MSVAVDRKPVKSPICEIAAGTNSADWNGNTVVFTLVREVFAPVEPTLEVQTRLNDGGRGRGCLAHLNAADARELAAALLEWADSVEG